MDKTTRAALTKIGESFKKQAGGHEVVFIGSEDIEDNKKIERVSSGSLALDNALGGGFPEGRIVEILGKESSGKTTISLFTLAELQKKYPEKVVAFIDAERSFDLDLAVNYGIDPENLIYCAPVSGESALDMVESFIVSGVVSGVVVDSVAALVPTQEAQSDMASQQMGLQARMLGKALRKITGPAADNNVLVIFINQIREKVGVMYGNPETTPGGRALKFFSSVRLKVSPGEPIKDKDRQIGHEVKCRVEKNKASAAFRTASFKLLYNIGVDRYEEVAEMAVETELIKKGGAWLSMIDEETGEIINKQIGDETIPMRWQGMTKFAEYLREDEELYKELAGKLYAAE